MAADRDTTFDAPWHNNSWQVWQTDDGTWFGRPIGESYFNSYRDFEHLMRSIAAHRADHAEMREAARANVSAVIDRAQAAGKKRQEAETLLAELGLS